MKTSILSILFILLIAQVGISQGGGKTNTTPVPGGKVNSAPPSGSGAGQQNSDPQTPPAPEVKGQNVTHVEFPGGSFTLYEQLIDVKGKWAEHQFGRSFHAQYDETGRDEWSVYLYDRSRDVTIQLDLDQKKVIINYDRPSKGVLYDITRMVAGPPVPYTDVPCFIVAMHSNKALNIPYSSHDNGVQVIQWPYGVGNSNGNDIFYMRRGNSAGSVRFIADHSKKALDNNAGSSENGNAIQQWEDMPGNPNQEFWLEPADNESFYIRTQSGKVFDIKGISTENGAQLQQYQNGGGQNQKFRFLLLG